MGYLPATVTKVTGHSKDFSDFFFGDPLILDLELRIQGVRPGRRAGLGYPKIREKRKLDF